jgi:(1->4)-alpha-D-glucan 1-alpha-D-glucosylmutase
MRRFRPQLASLATAFGHLPPRDTAIPSAGRTRARQGTAQGPARAPRAAPRSRRAGARGVGGGAEPRRRRSPRCAAPADRAAGLPARALARGGGRDQLPPLLRHQRPRGAAHGARGGVRGHAVVRAGPCGGGRGGRPAHRPPRRALRPGRYFRKLQEGYARRAGLVLPAHDAKGRPARPLYVVAEKIAGAHEEVPERWHVHGTTGYRFANVANGVLVDTAAEANVVHAWQRFTGEMEDFADLARGPARGDAQRAVVGAERAVHRAAAHRAGRPQHARLHAQHAAPRAVRASARACRSTGPTSSTAPSAQDERFIDEAVDEAARQSGDADRSIFDFVRSALRGEAVASAPPALGERVRRFAVRFQQFSAPVAAKGVEDTAFYRYFPLSSLNEVGGEPDLFGIEVASSSMRSAPTARCAGRTPCWRPRRTTTSARKTCATASTCSPKCPTSGCWR